MFAPVSAMAATIALGLPYKTQKSYSCTKLNVSAGEKSTFGAANVISPARLCESKNEFFAGPEGMGLGRVGWAICPLSIGIYIED